MPIEVKKYVKDLELESKVVSLLQKGKTEKDILALLRSENNSDSSIVEAIANVCNDSHIVSSYCNSVLIPKIKNLLDAKYKIGEVVQKMSNSYPRILIDEALCLVLSEVYLVD